MAHQARHILGQQRDLGQDTETENRKYRCPLGLQPSQGPYFVLMKKEAPVLSADDQPIAKVYEALNATAFVASPYHNPVVGWMDDLQNMTATDALAWYERWYAPNNAVLIVAGCLIAARKPTEQTAL